MYFGTGFRRRCLGLLLTLVLALAASLTTTEARAAGFATAGIGIKARSMGGAFRGLANDWSAAYYNPAGLAWLHKGELNATLGTYSPQVTYTPNVTGSGVDLGFNQANGLELHPRDDVWPLPSFAVVALPNWRDGLAVGAAVYWPHDVNFGWDLYRQPAQYNSDFQFQHQNYRTDLDVLDVHPVVATTLGDKLAVGVGLSLTDGSVVLRRVEFVPNSLGSPFNVYPYDDFAGELLLKGRGFAVGANAGVMWKASPTLSVGFSFQLPTTIPVSGTGTLDMAWPINPAMADSQLNIANQQTEEPLFERTQYLGNYDEVRSTDWHHTAPFDFDLKLPGQVGAGIGWKSSERLTLAADLAITFWSAVESWDVTFSESGLRTGTDSVGHPTAITGVAVPFHWKDQIRLSAGAEYAATPKVMVRGGMYYDGGAAVDSTFSPNFPDVGGRVGLTAGVAYLLGESWEFAAAQELAFASGRTVPDQGTANGVTAFPGDYSLSRFETLFSISYRF
ncbi:MAG: outer membrane protein transport protein [Candidatus Zixiibacteriota bacterium]